MGEHHKVFGTHKLSAKGKKLAEALLVGVDEARGIVAIPDMTKHTKTPRKMTIDDFEWTWQEVEAAFINGTKAARSITNEDLKFLRNAVAREADKVRTFEEITQALADDKTKDDALKDNFTIDGYRFSSPPHHIDQFGDIVLWACWIPLASNRHLVWAVVAQKASGRVSADWAKAQSTAGMRHQSLETLRRRYRRILSSLARRLTEERYPRKRALY